MFLSNTIGLLLVAVSSLAGTAAAHGDHHHHHDFLDHVREDRHLEGDSRCGTRTLTDEEKARVEQDLLKWQEIHGPCNATYCPEGEQVIDISVVWHSIRTSSGTGGITDQMIADSIAVMNAAYARAGFSFTLTNTGTVTDNDSWYQGNDEFGMKSSLRQGDESTLNIYSTGIDLFTGILGYATFPTDYATDPLLDGVVIGTNTAPGGSTAPYNEGDTLVHEVGHWLFLYHVFQGGCTSPGDFVDDTPPQSTATDGCPVGQDSCPGGGLDLIQNYMDYSDDFCMNSFTDGQIARMVLAWNTYRATGNPVPTVPTAPTTAPPFPAPTPAPTCNFFICFSEQASVPVQNKGPVEMPDLKMGDKVLTANGYQELYAFAHNNDQIPVEFLQIHADKLPGNPLEISSQHMVYVEGKPYPVPAHSIQRGDVLKSTMFPDGVKVKEVKSVTRSGLYAPMTTDGTIVVDGIVSSCYIAIQKHSGGQMELQGGINSGISQHFFAHLTMTPVRLVCMGISDQFCQLYDEDGFAYYAKIGLAIADWSCTWWLPVQLVMLPIYLSIVGSLYALESVFGPKLAMWVIMAAGAVIAARKARRASKEVQKNKTD